MTEFEICIYQSVELTDHCDSEYGDPDRARKRAETYVSGAFNNISGHSVSFVTPSTDLDCPQQAIRQPIETTCPCYDPGKDCNYENLTGWFKHVLDCNGYREGSASTLLLTNGDIPNGGLAFSNGNKAAASVGRHVAALPSSYQKYGTSEAFEGMETALHEIGHNILPKGFDDDGDGVDHHDVGDIVYWYDNYYKTPLDINGDTNDCGKEPFSIRDGWWMVYSNCAISNLN